MSARFVRLRDPATNETRDLPTDEFQSRTAKALKDKGYSGWKFVKEHDEAVPPVSDADKEKFRLRSIPRDEVVAELRAEIEALAARLAALEGKA